MRRTVAQLQLLGFASMRCSVAELRLEVVVSAAVVAIVAPSGNATSRTVALPSTRCGDMSVGIRALSRPRHPPLAKPSPISRVKPAAWAGFLFGYTGL